MPGSVKMYDKNVFTNDGQSDVRGFAEKLEKIKEKVLAAGAIAVYFGFHGTEKGDFDRLFSDAEVKASREIATKYPEVVMIQVKSPTDELIKYADHNKDGAALFTWCDSDTYIKDNKKLPNIVT